MAQDQKSPGDQVLKTSSYSDGLGRLIETDTFETASQFIATRQTYDALGRLQTVTNPIHPGDAPSLTTYACDTLGRTLSTTTADGVVTRMAYDQGEAANEYDGSKTVVTDPSPWSKIQGH